MQTGKTLIRLGGSQGWSESLLGARDLFGFVMLRLSFQRMRLKICISNEIYNFFTT